MAKLTRKQIREGFDQIPVEGLLFGTAAATAAEAKLTPKQREFARMLALGESKAGAYRKAYNSKGSPKTQANNAYALTKRNDIATTTEAFRQAIQFSESHTPAQIRAFVIQQLTQHAQNEEIPPAQRIKSLELLGKVAEVGAFVDRKEVVNVQSSQTIRERLLEKLAASGRVIEHAPQDTDADSLLQELAPPPAENAETDTHPTPDTLISGGNCAEDAHIIPHKRSPAESPITDTAHLSPTADIADGEWTDIHAEKNHPDWTEAAGSLQQVEVTNDRG